MLVMGYDVFDGELEDLDIIKEQFIINTINPHSYVVAKSDKSFSNSLKNSDILLPDGIGIVMATRIISGKRISKIAGNDLHHFLLKKNTKIPMKIFYMGSQESTLEIISLKIKKDYPNYHVEYYSPPFKDKFTEKDNNSMIEKINMFSPDILFVGMTAPKQEKWVFENCKKLDAKIICSIGAVFDYYAETKPRISSIGLRLNLEWLLRLIKEPKRMWKRNFISTPIFLKDLLIFKIKNKKGMNI